jgi:transketolase
VNQMDASSRQNSFDSAASRRRCKTYRKRILDISQQVGALHIAPAFSCLEAVDVIHHGLIRRSGKEMLDTFLMSKGHGCMSQYVILEEFGILTADDLAAYCKSNGRLGAHPDYGTPGIAASTGSLGHGLGIACGMAYADRLQNDDRRTYVVLSDGECQEGSTWEAIMMSANLKLDNLTAFLDLNDFSGMDRMSVTHPAFYPVADKLRAFGWEVHEVNGHDASAVFEAAQAGWPGKPLIVVCKTVKGRGVSYMEHVPIWHYRSPNKQEYEQALRELAEISS